MVDNSRVYVIDDDSRNLESLHALLTSRGYQVNTFKSPDAFCVFPKPHAPACLILDTSVCKNCPFDVQEKITNAFDIPVICLSCFVDIQAVVRAMRAGAAEFLLKPVNEEQLLIAVSQAIKQACEQWTNHQLYCRLRDNYSRLSPREKQVLPFIVAGFLNKQTAYELGTAEITIRIHRAQIMRKMNASSLAELVRFADRLGIPESSPATSLVAGDRRPEYQLRKEQFQTS